MDLCAFRLSTSHEHASFKATSVLLCALVIAFQVINIDCNFLSTTDPIIKEFDLINENLSEALGDNNDPLKNLMEAMSWMKLSGGQLPKKGGPSRLPSVESLIIFTSLLRLLDPSQPLCSLVGLSIMMVNENACGTRISGREKDLGPLRKIESIVHQVGMTHARQCRYEYPKKFKQIMSKKNDKQEIINDVATMMNRIIRTSARRVFKSSPFIDERYILKELSLGVDVRDREAVKALLMYLAEKSRNVKDSRFLSVTGDPLVRNKWYVNEAKVAKLMNIYVFNRCRYVDRVFGRVLEPASYDQRFEGNNYRPINEEHGEIMIWLQYYRLCHNMLRDTNGLIEKVVEQIEMNWNSAEDED